MKEKEFLSLNKKKHTITDNYFFVHVLGLMKDQGFHEGVKSLKSLAINAQNFWELLTWKI